jgi:hypothetical protein
VVLISNPWERVENGLEGGDSIGKKRIFSPKSSQVSEFGNFLALSDIC